MQIAGSPFAQFTDRINKDLFAWTLKKQEYEGLLTDYSNTLSYLQNEANLSATLLVDLAQGEGVLAQGRRANPNIVLRMREDLYVELGHKEAERAIKDLLGLYEDKKKAAEAEIRKITASMREVEDLIQQYSSLA